MVWCWCGGECWCEAGVAVRGGGGMIIRIIQSLTL